MTVTRRITTARYDIYTDLVTRTAKDELEENEDEEEGDGDEDEDELDNEYEYPFDTNYQLFAAGLTLGFLQGEKREESKGEYVPGFIQVNRIGGGGDNEFRRGIELVYELIKLEHSDLEEDEVWEEALQYADAGVEFIYNDMEIKDEFDLLYFMDEARSEWDNRLEAIIDYPQEDTE